MGSHERCALTRVPPWGPPCLAGLLLATAVMAGCVEDRETPTAGPDCRPPAAAGCLADPPGGKSAKFFGCEIHYLYYKMDVAKIAARMPAGYQPDGTGPVMTGNTIVTACDGALLGDETEVPAFAMVDTVVPALVPPPVWSKHANLWSLEHVVTDPALAAFLGSNGWPTPVGAIDVRVADGVLDVAVSGPGVEYAMRGPYADIDGPNQEEDRYRKNGNLEDPTYYDATIPQVQPFRVEAFTIVAAAGAIADVAAVPGAPVVADGGSGYEASYQIEFA